MAALDAGVRMRVERLLRGGVRNDDLSTLFLYARGRPQSHQSVQEVGHFVAHREQRTRGVTTQRARDYFRIVSYAVNQDGQKLDVTNLPSTYPAFLAAVIKNLPIDTIKRFTGLRQKVAFAKLREIAGRLHKKPDGNYEVGAISTEDLNLLKCASFYFRTTPVFTGESLAEGLSAALSRDGLLEPSEVRQFNELNPLIAVFAVSMMHNTTLVMDDGTHGHLMFATRDDNINVVVVCPPLEADGQKFRWVSPLVTTAFKATEHCETDLLPAREEGAHWGRTLEITQNGRLGFLV